MPPKNMFHCMCVYICVYCQMERLLARSKEQVEEEETLCAELKKIEMRKKEREKKQQDLQKLISAAEQNTSETLVMEHTHMSAQQGVQIGA